MKYREFLENTIDLPYNEWEKKLKEFAPFIVEKLYNLVQDTKWHPEIFVLKHTYYVLQALKEVNMPELYEAGLFHDYGKSTTTLIHADGKITSYGHANAVDEILEQQRLRFSSDFESLKWVINRHMDFDVGHKRFKQKDKYDEPYDLLEKFVWADKKRSRELFFETEGYQQYFENVAKCHTIKFGDRDAIFYTPTLYINIGISGAGKSTIESQHMKKYKVVCPDDIRKERLGYVGFDPRIESDVWSKVRYKIKNELMSGRSVVLDATNVNRYTRVKFLSNIKSRYNSSSDEFKTVGVIYPYVDVDEARQRIEKDLQNRDRSDVPMNVLNRQQKNLMDSMKQGFTDLDKLKIIN